MGVAEHHGVEAPPEEGVGRVVVVVGPAPAPAPAEVVDALMHLREHLVGVGAGAEEVAAHPSERFVDRLVLGPDRLVHVAVLHADQLVARAEVEEG